jgi:LPS export ABC transporter protein LptC
MINFLFNKRFVLQAALCSCLFLFACENDPEDINRLSGKKTMLEEGRDITSYLSQNGNTRAKLMSPLMYRYQEDTIYVEFPRTLKVDFFDSTNSVESQVFARYGKYFETRNKILLRDSVVVNTLKGDTLWTEELWWDQNSQKFYTDKPAHVKRKGQDIIGGQGMEASQDLRDILFRRPTGIIEIPDSMAQR